jgi:hypothetical protein
VADGWAKSCRPEIVNLHLAVAFHEDFAGAQILVQHFTLMGLF